MVLSASDVGVLRLYQPTAKNSSLLWQASGNLGNSWINQEVTINSSINWQVWKTLLWEM